MGNSNQVFSDYQPTGSEHLHPEPSQPAREQFGATVEKRVGLLTTFMFTTMLINPNSFNFAYSTDDDNHTDLTAPETTAPPKAADGSPAMG